MIKRDYILALAAALAMASCNELKRGNDSNLNEKRNEAAAESNTDKFAGKKQKDANFVYEVIATNYGEIKLAELANQKSRTSEVKKIAQQLLIDHTSSLNGLKTLAQAKAISVPVEEENGIKRRVGNIAKESGQQFDKEWCKAMIDLHQKSIHRFENHLKDTEDEELKAFINKTLPVLKRHLENLEAGNESLTNKEIR